MIKSLDPIQMQLPIGEYEGNSKKPIYKMQNTISDIADIGKPMSEYMVKFGSTLNGNLNKKTAGLIMQSRFFNLINTGVDGIIDGKNIKATIDKFSFKNKTYKGKYGKKEFILNLEKTKMSESTRYIRGKIDGKEVSFDLKASKFPKDTDTQDIISSLLIVNGEAVKIKEDRFCGIKKPTG